MKVNVNLWCDDSHSLNDPGQYRRLIEKLIYLIVIKPDISFAVGVLSRFMHQPREIHWTATLRILVYIKSSPAKGLMYKKHEHIRIFGYSDSDYAGDKEDRKSTTGYCIFVEKNLVTLMSKKQNVVYRFSTDVEYRSMARTICKMM